MREDTLTRRLHLPPLWTLLLAIVIGFAVTVWRVVGLRTAVESPLSIAQVLWPGVAAVVAVYIFAWLGWALDID